MLKVVFDTNIYISLLCKPNGVCGNLFDDKILGKMQIVVSDYILEEVYNVGYRNSFRRYFPKNKVDELIGLLERDTLFVHVKKEIKLMSNYYKDYILDKKDLGIYLTYLRSRSDFLVTGNRKHFNFKKAISPNDFLLIME